MKKEFQFLLMGIIAGLVVAVIVYFGQREINKASYNEVPEQPAETLPRMEEGVTSLKFKELKSGDGAEVKAGSQVSVHYTGWLYDGSSTDLKGKEIDSSRTRNQPFVFRAGASQVIPGWDKGVLGMRVGGTRQLIIPAKDGYGERGAGSVIPPNATLVFEIELVEIKK